jgi:hypothetical protein
VLLTAASTGYCVFFVVVYNEELLLGTVKAETSCASKRDEYSESPRRPWLVSDVMLCSALE